MGSGATVAVGACVGVAVESGATVAVGVCVGVAVGSGVIAAVGVGVGVAVAVGVGEGPPSHATPRIAIEAATRSKNNALMLTRTRRYFSPIRFTCVLLSRAVRKIDPL